VCCCTACWPRLAAADPASSTAGVCGAARLAASAAAAGGCGAARAHTSRDGRGLPPLLLLLCACTYVLFRSHRPALLCTSRATAWSWPAAAAAAGRCWFLPVLLLRLLRCCKPGAARPVIIGLEPASINSR
jgi:hypothetical protein